MALWSSGQACHRWRRPHRSSNLGCCSCWLNDRCNDFGCECDDADVDCFWWWAPVLVLLAPSMPSQLYVLPPTMLIPLLLPQWLVLPPPPHPPPPYDLFLWFVVVLDDKSSFSAWNWWWLAWRLGVIILLCSIIGVVSIGELVLVSLQYVNGISSIRSNVCNRCNGDIVLVAWFFGLPCNLHDTFILNASIFLCEFSADYQVIFSHRWLLVVVFVGMSRGTASTMSRLLRWKMQKNVAARRERHIAHHHQMSEIVLPNDGR